MIDLLTMVSEYLCLMSCLSLLSHSYASSCFSFLMLVDIKCIIVRIYFKPRLPYLLSHFMIVVFLTWNLCVRTHDGLLYKD